MMAEHKHTPGPWLVQEESDGEWSVWTRQPHIGTLATVSPEDMNGDYPAEANARLIAAAPDLLEAAVLVLSGLDARIDAAPKDKVPVFAGIAELHDAITKALGEAAA